MCRGPTDTRHPTHSWGCRPPATPPLPLSNDIHPHMHAQGNQYKVSVEYAPFQKVPSREKKNPLEGTIEQGGWHRGQAPPSPSMGRAGRWGGYLQLQLGCSKEAVALPRYP